MRRRRLATVVLAALVLVAHLTNAASAGWSARTSPASLPVSTASLAPPSGLAAANRCLLTVPSVALSWTATPSSFASGYRVYRRLSTDAAFSLRATVSGRSTTSYSDSTVVGGSSYVYVVHAYYAGWSATTGSVSITVPLLCL